jgi:ribosomal protein S18 acetylase RimI-like enzyme
MPTELASLEGPDRELAVPVIIDSFTGIYRWHAKRTLREATWVRSMRSNGEIIGLTILERLTDEVGYVYYVAVHSRARGRRVGGALLDDALGWLFERGSRIVYAVVTEGNAPSEALFRSRGFRRIERKELAYDEGGLGAWGLRSRMRIVHGEVLMGRRLYAPPREAIDPSTNGSGDPPNRPTTGRPS